MFSLSLEGDTKILMWKIPDGSAMTSSVRNELEKGAICAFVVVRT